MRARTINSSNRDDWAPIEPDRADEVDLLLLSPERLANQGSARRPAGLHRPRRPARDRRGALHLRLGPRLPPRLPPDRRAAAARCPRRRGAVHDGDRQRPRGRRRRGAARDRRRRADHDPRHARPPVAAARGRRPAEPGRAAGVARDPHPEAAGQRDRLLPDRPRLDARLQLARSQGIEGEAYCGESDERDRDRAAPARQRGQVRRRHQRARHGLRQARPRLRRPLPGPGQPIAYYQQVGRAGPQLGRPTRCCCAGVEDRDVQDFFIKSAFPPEQLVARCSRARGEPRRRCRCPRSSSRSTSARAGWS